MRIGAEVVASVTHRRLDAGLCGVVQVEELTEENEMLNSQVGGVTVCHHMLLFDPEPLDSLKSVVVSGVQRRR